MRTSNNLPGRLETFFRFAFRFVIAMATLQLISALVPLVFSGAKTNDFISFARRVIYSNLSIRLIGPPDALKTNDPQPKAVALLKLRGDVLLNLNTADPELVTAFYLTEFPRGFVRTVYLIFLFGILRDVCGRIKRGDVFSENNLRAIRGLGLLLVLGNLANMALKIWSANRLGELLARQVTVTGVDAPIVAGSTPLFNGFDFSQVVTGLLVLLVAEAFRQGLALKKENELTV